MSEPNIDTAREVFPVRFDGRKSPQLGKDLRPRPVRADDVHISEVADPKAPSAQEPATDLTDLIPDETATQTSATVEQETATQTDSEATALMDQQPSSSPQESTTPGSETPPVTPPASPPVVTPPTSSSQKRTKETSATTP